MRHTTSARRMMTAFLSGLITLLLAGGSYAAPPADAVPVNITGDLTVQVLDDFEHKRAELQYFIEDKQSKKQYRLQFEGTPPGQLRAGSTVKVRGKAKGQDIYLASTLDGSTQPAIETVAYSIVPTVSGEQRTVVLVANFLDAQVSCTVDQIRDLMFTDPNNQSVDDYYRETSQDQIWFSGEVHGPYTINYSGNNTVGCGFSLSDFSVPMEAAAEADGVDLSQFDRKVYVVPRLSNCSYAGVGTVGDIPSTALVFACANDDTYGHELGHNLGMYHASTPTSEYGDGTDIMGKGGVGLRHLNSAHQTEMGWRSSADNILITQSGTYDIAPQSLYESQTLAPQILRIAIPNTDEYYYVAYRRPLGFDSNLEWWHDDKVTVHRYQGAGGFPTNTFLLDELAVGENFTDTTNNIKVSYVNQTPDYATVQIDVNGSTDTCTTGTPSVSLSPSGQNGAAGDTRSYTVSVTNADSGSCASSNFALSRTVPSGWTAALSSSTLNLAPGATGTATLSVTSAAGAVASTYPISATVSDSANTGHTASGSASYTVVQSCTVNAPTFTLSPGSQSGDPGATLAYTVSLVNNDSSTCSASVFDLTITSLPGGWNASLSAQSLNLSPGATGTATLSVTSASTSTAGSYTVQLGTTDAQTLHAASATATYAVNDLTPAQDTEAPTTPTGLSANANTNQVSLSWSASTDNVGVAGYQVFRDGSMIADTATTGYADRDAVDGVTYDYSIDAYDASGNVSPRCAPVSAGKAKAKAKGQGGGKGKGPNK